MRKAIEVRHELVFLSDRNQSIANGIRKIYPEARHDIFLYHFEKNLKQRHAKSTVINLFQSAARSYRREDFNQLMSQIKSVYKKIYNYIMEEPPERWARSWFPRRRYDMLTTNMVESMNPVLLKAREMPVLRMETWFKIYEGHVNTVGDQNSWNIPQNVESEIRKSPDVEILQGRRQKKRYIPATESVPLKSTKCNRCKQIGHNRTTCLSSPAPHPYFKKHAEKYSNVQ
ncbi:uncharacterized protein [Nicotiana tomentosiformis]|uniref:uncharacterized protein n=1 Tax=Nicotiana tomentosiformis TaxID=4098 RepID=UPI00051C0A75|nr:uncharacterized protein LOC104085719 [Nicotiana tomentosiformis]